MEVKKRKNNRRYDYIIIGGGLAGLSCAYWLSKDPNKSVAILEKGKVFDWELEKQFCNLSVGTLNYFHSLYKQYDMEKVLEVYMFMQSNLELIEDELQVIEKNPYVDLFDGGTISMIEDGNPRKIGFFQSFVHNLNKFDVPITQVESEKWQYGVKFSHDGHYDSEKFIKRIISMIRKKVDIFENANCSTLHRDLNQITATTTLGEEYFCKKVIFANGDGLTKHLPELKEELNYVNGMICEVKTEANDLDLVNYANLDENRFFVKVRNGYLFGKHAEPENNKVVDTHEMDKQFTDFRKKVLPSCTRSKEVPIKLSFTKSGTPVWGQSKKNPNIYYLGGFSGQSKMFAFKMAQDLVKKVEKVEK